MAESAGDRGARCTLRPEQPSDRDFLRRLYASTREDEVATVAWSDDEKRRFLGWQFEAQTRHYDQHYADAERLIVVVDGQPAGRLYVQVRDDELRVVDIALLPAARGRGIGGALMRDVMQRAQAGGRKVRIHVEATNPAQRLYQRLGFHRVDTNGVYHLLEWGASD